MIIPIVGVAGPPKREYCFGSYDFSATILPSFITYSGVPNARAVRRALLADLRNARPTDAANFVFGVRLPCFFMGGRDLVLQRCSASPCTRDNENNLGMLV